MSGLDDLLQRPAWQQHAACRGMGTDLFFPTPGQEAKIRKAKAVCASCPVRADCADAGLTEVFGIWGGRGEPTRRARRGWNDR